MKKHGAPAITVRGNERVEVQAIPQYLPDIKPPDGEYLFAYRIRIANLGNESVRLMSRKWEITDGNNEVREVVGDGVVGEQPHIAPGASYEYTSYVDMPTPIGTMRGSYTMRKKNGEEFEAEIPLFSLAVPRKYN